MVFRQDRDGNQERAAAERGIRAGEAAQAAEENIDWQPGNRAEELIRDVIAERYEFTSDDIWQKLELEIAEGRLDEPGTRSILGPIFKRLESDGIIVATPFTKSSVRRNAAPIKIWRANPQFAFRKWRDWGANNPDVRSEQVQAAKRGIDNSIRDNEARLEEAIAEQERLRELIRTDRNNSSELERRGYFKKRIPTFDEIMSESANFEQSRMQSWIEGTEVLTDAPVAFGGFQNMAYPEWRTAQEGDFADGFVAEGVIALKFIDSASGEEIGKMRLTHKGEDGSIGNSADAGIVGYQVVDVSGDLNQIERMNTVADYFIATPGRWKGGDYQLDFFQLNLEDMALERERESFRDANNAIRPDQLFLNSKMDDLLEIMKKNPELFDYQGYLEYRKKIGSVKDYPFMDEKAWMAWNPSQRKIMQILELDAAAGDLNAKEALADIENDIDEYLSENHMYAEYEYEDLIESRMDSALKSGKITQEEYDFYIYATKELGNPSIWLSEVDGIGDRAEAIYQKANIPGFEQWVVYQQFLNYRNFRALQGESDFKSAGTPSNLAIGGSLRKNWSQPAFTENRKQQFYDQSERGYFKRNINNKSFVSSSKTFNKRMASNLASRVRNTRYARVIPSSSGYRVFVGPMKRR